MKTTILELESKVKRKYHFGFQPKHSEYLELNNDKDYLIPLAFQVIKKLNWTITTINESVIEAKIKNQYGDYTEKLIVEYFHSRKIMTITSKSLNLNFFDFGKNSLRVGVFKLLFNDLKLNFNTPEKLQVLKNNFENECTWKHYKIANILPKPNKTSSLNTLVYLYLSLFISIFIGVISVLVSLFIIHNFVITSLLIGVLIGLIHSFLFKFSSNPTIKYFISSLIIMVIVSFLSYHLIHFATYIFISTASDSSINYLTYLNSFYLNFITLNNIIISTLIFILLVIVELIIMSAISFNLSLNIYSKYLNSIIPLEVIDFVEYSLNKGSNEEQLRKELAQKNWKNKTDQERVIFLISILNADI